MKKFGYCKDTLAPLPYEGERSVLSILQGFARSVRLGAGSRENGYLIGLTKDGANVSLEPGGALELSGSTA